MRDPIVHILGTVVLVTLTLAIARQLASKPHLALYPDSWAAPFAKKGSDIEGFLAPAPASLDKPVDPYALLADTLNVKKEGGKFTAESCYDADFLSQTNKTGNYIQRTNNFRHLGPDSCSAPRTELVNSFYMQS
jgi:hypothetical protein